MIYMTYNQVIALFEEIANDNKFIKEFAHGEAWEIEGKINPALEYPLLYAIPLQSAFEEQAVRRTFTLMVMAKVKKDKSDETEILSDTELILQDVIKALRNDDDDYNVVGTPIMIPFKEEFADWCAGWRADVEIETNGRSNDCDIPRD